jgi:hypothetical protein
MDYGVLNQYINNILKNDPKLISEVMNHAIRLLVVLEDGQFETAFEQLEEIMDLLKEKELYGDLKDLRLVLSIIPIAY